MTDDYYRYDERHFAMIGERTGKVFRIGDEITVRVVNVNKEERAIDFEIVGMKGTRRRDPNKEGKVFSTGSTSRPARKGKSGAGKDSRKGSGNSSSSGEGKRQGKKERKFFENAPKAKRKKKRRLLKA